MATLPKEWRETLNIVSKKYPEVVMLGGCLRDTILNRPVRNIDIFVTARDSYHNQEALEELLRTRLQNVVDVDRHAMNIADLDAVYRAQIGNSMYQFIALKKEFTLESVTDWVDFGICKIAYGLDGMFVHEHFTHDVLNKCFTLRGGISQDQSMLRHYRLQAKYEGWPLVGVSAWSQIRAKS